MYSLNYDMVVQILRQFNYSGEVHAQIPSHAVLRGGGRVVLMVKHGIVVSWVIFDSRGQQIYQDANAYHVLLKLGVVDWDLVPFTASQPAPFNTSPPVTPRISRTSQYFPCRLPVSPIQMRSWAVLYRSVYSLSDGTRSSEQIATILSRPLNTIVQTLYDLIEIGAIEMKGSKDQ